MACNYSDPPCIRHASLEPFAKSRADVAGSLRQALHETAVFLEDCLGELMLRDVESLLEQHCAKASDRLLRIKCFGG